MNKFDYSQIPDHMMEAINYYIKDGSYIGGFLTAVFSNDLFHAVSRADDENLALLPTYVCYIFNECPNGCFGSLEIIKAWQKKKREENREELNEY